MDAAKGTNIAPVPFAAAIAKAHGYGTIFTLFLTCNIIAALLALFVLKPMRVRHFAKGRETFGVAA